MGVPDRLLDASRRLALGLGDAEGLVHGLVPRLLFRGGVHRRVAGIGAVACAGIGVHDLARAGRIVARGRIGCTFPALAVPVPAVALVGGIGRIAGFIAVPAGRRLPARPGARATGILRLVSVVTGIPLPQARAGGCLPAPRSCPPRLRLRAGARSPHRARARG